MSPTFRGASPALPARAGRGSRPGPGTALAIAAGAAVWGLWTILPLPAPRGESRLAAAEPPAAERDTAATTEGGDEVAFLRLTRDSDKRPLSLDTSIVRYRETADSARNAGRSRRVEVDLVGAVHLGGKTYYDTLDNLFEGYDAVLYELVAPDNARVPTPGRKPGGAIGGAQQGMTKMLGLEFQLDQIDYKAPNFVHADMSPKEFDEAMKRRGETWWTMFSRLLREGAERAERGRPTGPEVGIGDLFGLLFGSGREIRLRRIMAEQFTDMEVLTAAFGGEEGSTLITDRNGAALEVLAEQITAGKRRLAIFYGAAHMEDFDRRLRSDFGMEPVEVEWVEAWDLRMPAAK